VLPKSLVALKFVATCSLMAPPLKMLSTVMSCGVLGGWGVGGGGWRGGGVGGVRSKGVCCGVCVCVGGGGGTYLWV
jgi:hypothetical protein